LCQTLYLEKTKPKNIAFYQKNVMNIAVMGFIVNKNVQRLGTFPAYLQSTALARAAAAKSQGET